MTLSDDDKRRIEEEEAYRASLRAKVGAQADTQSEVTIKSKPGCLSIFGFLIFVIILVNIISPSHKVSPEEKAKEEAESERRKCEDDKMMAFTMAEKLITPTLKAPSTAVFSSYLDSQVESIGNCSYGVSGYVDAQNAFGAQIRNKYLASVKYQGHHQWSLEQISLH